MTPVRALAAALLVGLCGQRLAEARDRRRFPRPGQLVRVAGADLHVLRSGSGPAVLIDSGLGGSTLEWNAVAARLDGEFTVVRYERPGFGWSPAGPRDRSPLAAATRLTALIADLQLGPCLLVGHSLGGLHVRLAAQLRPEQVSGLVLVDPSHEDMLPGGRTPPAARAAEAVMRALSAAAPFGVGRLAGRAYGATVTGQLREPLDADSRAALRQAIALTSCSVTGWRSAVAELRGLPDGLAQFRELGAEHPAPAVPVTVISAAAEPRSASERAGRERIRELHEQLVAALPFARLVAAERSGHLVPLDEPDLVARCVRETHQAAATGSWPVP